MKLVIFILLSSAWAFQDMKEYVANIKARSVGIKGRMFNSNFRQDQPQLDSLISILNLDVAGYYKIKDLYNTDPKGKEFIESEDYNSRYSELAGLKAGLLSTTFYIDFEPDYLAERSIGLVYSPDNRTLSVSNDINLNVFYDSPGYLQFDQIVFKCPGSITAGTRSVNYSCVDVIEEIISFPAENDTYKKVISRGSTDLRLLFLFRFSDLVSAKDKDHDPVSSDYSLIAELQEVIAYDAGTDEVYAVVK